MTTLMACLRIGRLNGQVLELARTLALDFDAKVLGLAACRVPTLLDNEDPDERNRQSGELERELVDAESEFRDALRSLGTAVEWRTAPISSPLAGRVAAEAGTADLVILGRQPPGVADRWRDIDLHRAILQLGRPALIAPPSGANDLKRVVIGWQETQESRRAAFDALPLLRRAEHVAVCELGSEDELSAAHARVEAVSAWLADNGIAAAPFAVLDKSDAAAGLEAVAADQSAGLIVAGAYGHGPLRERIVGGVTRALLTHSQRHLLLSH